MVKGFEGWNSRAYSDYGQRSIGYGTKAKKGEKTISREEGERRLAQELNLHRARVLRHMREHGYKWGPAQIDALTSFDYNTGSIEKLTKGGKRTDAQIAEMMLQYKKAGGKTLRGLERRRKAESQLFKEGWGEAATPVTQLDQLRMLAEWLKTQQIA